MLRVSWFGVHLRVPCIKCLLCWDIRADRLVEGGSFSLSVPGFRV